jgi:7-keto-8-aminopelargonate synthetase-like enzyme
MRRISAVQQRLDDACSKGNYTAAGTFGEELEVLETESNRIGLSEEDYLTLQERHRELVEAMDKRCKELVAAKKFKELGALNNNMRTFKALDLSALVQPRTGKICHLHASITRFR